MKKEIIVNNIKYKWDKIIYTNEEYDDILIIVIWKNDKEIYSEIFDKDCKCDESYIYTIIESKQTMGEKHPCPKCNSTNIIHTYCISVCLDCGYESSI